MVNSEDYEFVIVGNGGCGNNPLAYMRTIFSDVFRNKGSNPHSKEPIGYSDVGDETAETDVAVIEAISLQGAF